MVSSVLGHFQYFATCVHHAHFVLGFFPYVSHFTWILSKVIQYYHPLPNCIALLRCFRCLCVWLYRVWFRNWTWRVALSAPRLDGDQLQLICIRCFGNHELAIWHGTVTVLFCVSGVQPSHLSILHPRINACFQYWISIKIQYGYWDCAALPQQHTLLGYLNGLVHSSHASKLLILMGLQDCPPHLFHAKIPFDFDFMFLFPTM